MVLAQESDSCLRRNDKGRSIFLKFDPCASRDPGNKMRRYYVYILASKRHGVLYIGISSDLPRRVTEHREGKIKGFTKRYQVKRLVYVEAFQYVDKALEREKSLKRWKRDWKIELIEQQNPEWIDLYERLNDWL